MSVLGEAPVMLVLSWSSHQTRGSVAAVLQSGKMVQAQLELHLYDTKTSLLLADPARHWTGQQSRQGEEVSTFWTVFFSLVY